jgi:deoxyribonuclease V
MIQEPMLVCVDVDYRDDATVAGCVLFRSWADDSPTEQLLAFEGQAKPYLPGQFYLRELPPIVAVLGQVKVQLEAIIVDGYVWLDQGRTGLGAHLYSQLENKVPVIGVAKNPWQGHVYHADKNERRAIEVSRGGSKRPLYVTSVGTDVQLAARNVAAMHGSFRIPTLLSAVNTLVRSAKP